MGPTHALTGAVAYMSVALTFTPDAPTGDLIAGTVLTAGAALLPDMDHPSGTIANAWGPFSAVPAAWVEQLTGGHRRGTHTALAVPVGAAAAYGLGVLGGWWAAVLAGLLVGIGVKALLAELPKERRGRRDMEGLPLPVRRWIANHPRRSKRRSMRYWPRWVRVGWAALMKILHRWPLLMAASLGLGWILAPQLAPWQLAAVVAIGWVMHLAGDVITQKGVPLWLPFRREPVKFTTLDTGDLWETMLGWVLFVALAGQAALAAS